MVPHFHRASELMPCDLSHRRAAATLHGITSLIRVFRSEASVIPAVATSSKAVAADVLIMSWHSLLDLPAITASRSLSRLPRPVDAFGARLMRVMAVPFDWRRLIRSRTVPKDPSMAEHQWRRSWLRATALRAGYARSGFHSVAIRLARTPAQFDEGWGGRPWARVAAGFLQSSRWRSELRRRLRWWRQRIEPLRWSWTMSISPHHLLIRVRLVARRPRNTVHE